MDIKEYTNVLCARKIGGLEYKWRNIGLFLCSNRYHISHHKEKQDNVINLASIISKGWL
ncbi:Uncharacterised protein [uncultured archaeon]|nr:Uncharacterised protein [uncultured archaeon]